MFKKAFKVSSHNAISGKDKKKLAANLKKLYDEESVSLLIEKGDPTINCDKLSGSKMLIYTIDSIPLFVDSTGKGALFPSLYAVHLCPNLIKPVEINAGVETFIKNGANLMWPGVKDPKALGDFAADDVRYIVASDGTIVGLGAMGCSSKSLESGSKTPAMLMLHIVDDKLWQLGPKKVLPALVTQAAKEEEPEETEQIEAPSKEGESKSEDKKQEKAAPAEEEEEEEEDEPIEEDPTMDALMNQFGGMVKKGPSKKDKKKAAAAATKQKEEAETSGTLAKQIKEANKAKDTFEDEEEKTAGGKKGKKGKKESKKGKKGKKAQESDDEEDNEEEKAEIKPSEPTIPPKIMDEYLLTAFMTALKISVNDKDLPLDAGEFHSNHLLLCKSEDLHLEVKNSTYKKIGKFLQSMAKEGFIDFKESKKGEPPKITRIHRDNEKLADFVPTMTKVVKKEKEEEKADADKWPKITIDQIYKIKKDLYQFFIPEGSDADKPPKEVYSKDEVHQTLLNYLTKNKLIDKRSIKLDARTKPLFWEEQKPTAVEEVSEKIEEIKTSKDDVDSDEDFERKPKQKIKTKKAHIDTVYSMPKDSFFKKLDSYCNIQYKITDLADKKSSVTSNFKGVTIVAEKSHNKNITRVTGLNTFKFDFNHLSTKFQHKFASAVSLHSFKDKNGEHTEVTVQGNWLNDINDYLVDECLIDKSFITLNDKLGKKKKATGFQK